MFFQKETSAKSSFNSKIRLAVQFDLENVFKSRIMAPVKQKSLKNSLTTFEESDPRVMLAVRLGRALHRYGIPTHRLESAMNRVLERLGLDGHFFAMPTGVLISFGLPEEHRTSLIRVDPGEVNLEKQTLLDELVTDIVDGQVSAAEGIRRVDHIVLAKSRYGAALTVAAFGLSSGAASRFFGGGWREAVVSAGIGVVIGVLSVVLKDTKEARSIIEPAASLVAAVLAVAAASALRPLSVYITTLAGLVVLLPGLMVTTAVRELATNNLISGTARLTGAALIFFEMGFGVALGSRNGPQPEDMLRALFVARGGSAGLCGAVARQTSGYTGRHGGELVKLHRFSLRRHAFWPAARRLPRRCVGGRCEQHLRAPFQSSFRDPACPGNHPSCARKYWLRKSFKVPRA